MKLKVKMTHILNQAFIKPPFFVCLFSNIKTYKKEKCVLQFYTFNLFISELHTVRIKRSP